MKLEDRRWPWKCGDCLDSGVMGRGTQQDFCHCKEGQDFKAEAEEEARKGLIDHKKFLLGPL